MAAAGVEVAAELLDVDRDEADGVGSIQENGHAALVGCLRHLASGQDEAGASRNVAQAEQLGTRRDEVVQPLDYPVRLVRRKRQLSHDDAPALHEVHPRQRPGGMLLVGDDHLVARLPVNAGGDDVDALGHVPGEGNLVGRCPEQARHVDPRPFVDPLDLLHDLLRQRGVLLNVPRHPHDLVGHGRRLRAVAHVQVAAMLQSGNAASYLVDVHVKLR